MFDATLLARIQFGANITFDILFPSISIALAWVLLFFKLRFNATDGRKLAMDRPVTVDRRRAAARRHTADPTQASAAIG